MATPENQRAEIKKIVSMIPLKIEFRGDGTFTPPPAPVKQEPKSKEK